MRLGIGSYTYAWAVGVTGYPPPFPMGAEEVIARAATVGVGVVQLSDNLPLGEMSEQALARIAAQATRLGIGLEIGTRGIAPEQLRAYLRVAHQLRSSLVRVVTDTAEHHPPKEEVVRLLGEALPEFERRGVTLAIENHDRFRAREFREIVTSLGSAHVGICLDTVNSFGALEGPEVVVDTLAPLAVSLHVKDFAVTRQPHQMGFVIKGRPAGQGRLDVPWLLEQLRATGRDPNAILELWTPPEPDLALTIAKEARWAEESIAHLRQYIET